MYSVADEERGYRSVVKPRLCLGILVALLPFLCPTPDLAQQATAPLEPPPPSYGPWNAVILPGGDGLREKLAENDPILQPESSWTLVAWVNAEDDVTGDELIAGVGAPDNEYPRYLAIAPGKVELYLGQQQPYGSAGVDRSREMASARRDLRWIAVPALRGWSSGEQRSDFPAG